MPTTYDGIVREKGTSMELSMSEKESRRGYVFVFTERVDTSLVSAMSFKQWVTGRESDLTFRSRDESIPEELKSKPVVPVQIVPTGGAGVLGQAYQSGDCVNPIREHKERIRVEARPTEPTEQERGLRGKQAQARPRKEEPESKQGACQSSLPSVTRFHVSVRNGYTSFGKNSQSNPDVCADPSVR